MIDRQSLLTTRSFRSQDILKQSLVSHSIFCHVTQLVISSLLLVCLAALYFLNVVNSSVHIQLLFAIFLSLSFILVSIYSSTIESIAMIGYVSYFSKARVRIRKKLYSTYLLTFLLVVIASCYSFSVFTLDPDRFYFFLALATGCASIVFEISFLSFTRSHFIKGKSSHAQAALYFLDQCVVTSPDISHFMKATLDFYSRPKTPTHINSSSDSHSIAQKDSDIRTLMVERDESKKLSVKLQDRLDRVSRINREYVNEINKLQDIIHSKDTLLNNLQCDLDLEREINSDSQLTINKLREEVLKSKYEL
ncbi:hypothetical protein GEMRC1_012011 [Eukaryota sp. GEM-RC1]